jgi:hypothetical protein
MSSKDIYSLYHSNDDLKKYKKKYYNKRDRTWSDVSNLITEETGKHSRYCNGFIIIIILLFITIGSYSILNRIL